MNRQLDNVDAIVVPVGGGGLIAGIAVAVKVIQISDQRSKIKNQRENANQNVYFHNASNLPVFAA